MIGCSAQMSGRLRGGVEIVQFMVRAALDASPDYADMQDDASNAFNEFLRRPLFEELSANPVLRPLLRVATIVESLHGNAITGNRNRHLRVRTRTPLPSTAPKSRYPMGIYLIYIHPHSPSNGPPQYIHYWRDRRTKTPPEYNVQMCPLSCPPWGSHNTPRNGHHSINSCQTRVIRRGLITCRRVTRKCHHRESNPAPPCPEPYAVKKYRAEKSVPDGDI
jgi:hypothetical protein